MTMTTDTAPAVDTSSIEHLDVEPVCTVRDTPTTRCGDPAAWWVHLRSHCVTGTFDALWCAEHHDNAMELHVLACATCKTVVPLEDHLIRKEPLR